MRDLNNIRTSPIRSRGIGLIVALATLVLVPPSLARAGKFSWLDDVVQEVVREARVSGKGVVRGTDGASTTLRGSGRLFAHEADDGLEVLVKRSDDLARSGRKVEDASEALLQRRFARLLPRDAEAARTFSKLAPAEKRLVVEVSEAAEMLARRYPRDAEGMIKALGTEGLTAVRVFGDDVAETLVKEGPSSMGVLRKTGRGGWEFFTGTVLPHKKKLMAAGVLAAFLADPDKFVDYAGRATEYAVREFSKAGVQIAGAVSGGATRGLEASIASSLEAYGLNFAVLRYLGMGIAGVVVLVASMVLLGLPVRWALGPFIWPVQMVLKRWRSARVA